jgi:Holliday junction resolvase RusA-like endonuclease
VTRLELPYPPSNNSYKRHYCTVDNHHAVSASLTPAAREFKHTAGWLAKDAYREPLSGPVAVKILAYMPPRRMDADNVLKVLLDALNGVAWEDDRQVTDLQIILCEGSKNPHLVVDIAPATASTPPEPRRGKEIQENE